MPQGAGQKRFLATVLFTDIVGSTDVASELGDVRWRELLSRHHALIRKELKRFGGREIDTAGDGFFATFDAPAGGIRCACAASEAVEELGIDIRAGLHFGECEQMGKKVGGIAVHTAARVLSVAGPSEVMVTSTAKDLVAGSGIDLKDHGVHQLKGIPGEWRLFVVSALDGTERPPPLDPEVAAELRDRIQPTPGLRRRRVPIAIGAAVVVVAIAIGGFLLTRNEETVIPGPNTVAEIPAGANAFSRAIGVGDTPSGVAAGEGSIWVINQSDSTVTRIDPVGDQPVVATKSTFGVPTGVATGEGATWITTGFGAAGTEGTLDQLDPASNDITPVQNVTAAAKAVAVGSGSVWVTDGVNDRVLRIDPATGAVVAIQVGERPAAIAIESGEGGSVWVANALGQSVTRIDPSDDEPQRFDLASAPTGIAVDDKGNVWVTSSEANSVTRLDPTGHTVVTITNGVPRGPAAIAVAGGRVWVAGTLASAVARIDAATNTVTGSVSVDGTPSGLAVDAAADVWVTVRSV
jgi:streptogramin lyase/class 3 adenylate cyclase